MQQVAVVTVTYSPGEYLAQFLDTLPNATTAETQVVLADNGSTDGAPEAAAEREHVRLVRTGGNIGYGAGINHAVAEVDPSIEFIVVANPDLRWSEGSIDKLIEAAQRWPEGGAFGPLIRETDGTVYPSARALPDLVAGTAHAVAGALWRGNPGTRRYLQRDNLTERGVGWLSGSCLLMRRKAFDAIGGFDGSYFMFMEDVDLGDRLAKAGWHNIYVPAAEVVHAKSHAVSRHPEKMIPAHHRSVYKYMADRHPQWWQTPLRVGLRAGLAARSAIAVRAAVRAQRHNATEPARQQDKGEK